MKNVDKIEIGFDYDAVIVGNGDFPSHDIPVSFINSDKLVVCCDGAANDMIKNGYIPNLIIGDGDSISKENMERYKDIIHINSDQETNDQTKAVEYLVDKGYKNIAIVGATGKREDHTLGNISLLMEYHRKGINVRMYTDYGVFIPLSGSASFNVPEGNSVSIFGFGTSGMKSEGLKYEIRDFTALWQGTLNVVDSYPFKIETEGDYIVYICYYKHSVIS